MPNKHDMPSYQGKKDCYAKPMKLGDYNKLQGYGKTNEVINLEPLNEKLKSFNWDVIEIDGHNFEEIEQALCLETNKPKAIIAHTIKGKGVSYMENEFIWHYKSPNEEELIKALNELN